MKKVTVLLVFFVFLFTVGNTKTVEASSYLYIGEIEYDYDLIIMAQNQIYTCRDEATIQNTKVATYYNVTGPYGVDPVKRLVDYINRPGMLQYFYYEVDCDNIEDFFWYHQQGEVFYWKEIVYQDSQGYKYIHHYKIYWPKPAPYTGYYGYDVVNIVESSAFQPW